MKKINVTNLFFAALCVMAVGCSRQEEAQKVKQEELTVYEAREERAYINDFNAGSKPNYLGGDFGAFNRTPSDFSQGCVDFFDPSIKHGDSGFSLILDYDVDSSLPALCGYWSKLNGFDAAGYTKLVLWVKGDAAKGYTTVFKIELKSDAGEKGEYCVTGVTAEWKKVEVPLENFAGLTNLSSLSEFVVVFEDTIASQKEGSIWIDDIYFVK